jgi:hypothetical protein
LAPRGVQGRARGLAAALPRGKHESGLPSLAAFFRACVRRGAVVFPEGDFVPLVVPERAAGLAACVFVARIRALEPFSEAGLPGPLLRPEVRVVVLLRRWVS